MHEPVPVRAEARPRFRDIITTILMVLISVMIVRDLVRRWSSPAPAPSDVTERSR